MDARQRLLTVLEGGIPDRVPVVAWIDPALGLVMNSTTTRPWKACRSWPTSEEHLALTSSME